MSRRERMNSCISSVVSSAYTWSPRKSTRSGHRTVASVAIFRARVRRASTPCDLFPLRSWATLVRHDPNAIRSGLPGRSVGITLGGYVAPSPSVGGHTLTPSIFTPYGVMVPGWSPSATTIA